MFRTTSSSRPEELVNTVISPSNIYQMDKTYVSNQNYSKSQPSNTIDSVKTNSEKINLPVNGSQNATISDKIELISQFSSKTPTEQESSQFASRGVVGSSAANLNSYLSPNISNKRFSLISQNASLPYMSPSNISARTISTAALGDRALSESRSMSSRVDQITEFEFEDTQLEYKKEMISETSFDSTLGNIPRSNVKKSLGKDFIGAQIKDYTPSYQSHTVIEPQIQEAPRLKYEKNDALSIAGTGYIAADITMTTNWESVPQNLHEPIPLSLTSTTLLPIENTSLEPIQNDNNNNIYPTVPLKENTRATGSLQSESIIDLNIPRVRSTEHRHSLGYNHEFLRGLINPATDFHEGDVAESPQPEIPNDMEKGGPIQHVTYDSASSLYSESYLFSEVFSIWRITCVILVCMLIPLLFYLIYYADRGGLSTFRILKLILRKEHRMDLLRIYQWDIDIKWFRTLCFWIGTFEFVAIFACIGVGFGIGLTRD